MVSATDIRFSNPEWASRREMFTGQYLDAEVALMPFLDGVLDLRFVLVSPDLLLETDAEGRSKWSMGGAATGEGTDEAVSSQDAGGFPLRPFLREVRLEQVKVAFRDAAAGRTHNADFETLLLRSKADDLVVELKGRIDEHALSVADFRVDMEDGSTKASATGQVEDVVTLSGVVADVAVESASQAAFFTIRRCRVAGPRSLQGLGEGRIQWRYLLDRRHQGRVAAEDIQATLEGSLTDAIGVKGLDATLPASLASLATLNALTGRKLPDSGPLSLTGKATNEAGLDAPSHR